MAFTLQGIWCLCNHVLHNGGPADIYGSIHQIHYRFMEFSTLTNQSTRLPPPPSFASWVPPPTDWDKLNVDAAISTTKVALAVVAWNNSGDVIKVWAKLQNSCSPLLAEASSILWAAQLAKSEAWSQIIVEGDAKIHFDSLYADWAIKTVLDNSLCLAESFSNCSFSWVKRNRNVAAHKIAKFTLNSNVSFCFNNGNLPPFYFLLFCL